MAMPTPPMRILAERLLARESARVVDGEHEGVRLCEKMRISLIGFAGAEGFVSLLRRALNMAGPELPPAHGIEVQPDGRLIGLYELALKLPDHGHAVAVVITGHLLGLLVIFIGESLTLRFVCDAYPNAASGEPDTRIEVS